jgi:hypothetical protein
VPRITGVRLASVYKLTNYGIRIFACSGDSGIGVLGAGAVHLAFIALHRLY